jgi:hypothetical protein
METETQKPAQLTPTKAAPKSGLLEGAALVLLSLGTVGTAWCSYEAASWGGAAQGAMNLSTASSRRAATKQVQTYQVTLLDVVLFSQYMNARGSSNETLARFYADRFRGEAKTAFAAWMATRPFENTNAPPHPFVTNLYQPRLLEEARLEEAEAQRTWEKAGEAGRTSRGYVLLTVVLACALFCAGMAAKFEVPWVRRTVLALGLVAFLFAAGRLLLLPVQ